MCGAALRQKNMNERFIQDVAEFLWKICVCPQCYNQWQELLFKHVSEGVKEFRDCDQFRRLKSKRSAAWESLCLWSSATTTFRWWWRISGPKRTLWISDRSERTEMVDALWRQTLEEILPFDLDAANLRRGVKRVWRENRLPGVDHPRPDDLVRDVIESWEEANLESCRYDCQSLAEYLEMRFLLECS